MVDFMALMASIRDVYTTDDTPWVIGFSGGKDSTTVLQMVFHALSGLPRARLSKAVHVICNDTLVENPVIRERVGNQLPRIEAAGREGLFNHAPHLFKVALLSPQMKDRFWVNLVGNGYPSPNRWFRWCTERLKINPTSEYVRETVREHGKVIIVLGTRVAESANRAASMSSHNTGNVLRTHTLPGAFVYPPIAELSNNEVWAYLLQSPNPWKSNNRDLLALYRDACEGGECPFVIETGTQSCGKSRFGCWVCTVVERDKSMENFVNNGHAWMRKLLDFRNWLYEIRQQDLQQTPRSYRRPGLRFGPFLLETRRRVFTALLRLQDALPIQVLSPDEETHIRGLLERDTGTVARGGLTRYLIQLRTGTRLAALADFDPLQVRRTRLGPFDLRGARVLRRDKTCWPDPLPPRMPYYQV